MTTEVLRNMLYAGFVHHHDLGYVVMDEVHYLADRFRGAVWEEVILHLPEHVRVVGPVGHRQQRRGVRRVAGRGPRRHDRRRRRAPAGAAVAAHAASANRLLDLFAGEDVTRPGPSCGSTRPCCAAPRRSAASTRPPGSAAPRGRRGAPSRMPRFRPPSRVDVVEQLDRAGLLPAIVFMFSRAGCDAAVGPVRAVGAAAQRRRTRSRRSARSSSERTADLPEGDLGVLGYWEWREALERGHRRAPRRAAAGVQGDRRGAVRPRPGEGRVRDRDAGAGDQHAGAHGRAGAAGQVQRRGARRPDAGGVHAAHRPGRAAGDRRRGARRRGVAAGGRPEAGRRAGLDADLPAAVVVPARLQHGRQPGRPGRRGGGP